MPWIYSPHSGGKKIPTNSHQEICEQVASFERARSWYPRIQLKVRFKGQFCYIDTIEEGDDRLFPLCRLRHFADGWSLALFIYSNDKYQPCVFSNGKSEGSIEEALKLSESFII